MSGRKLVQMQVLAGGNASVQAPGHRAQISLSVDNSDNCEKREIAELYTPFYPRHFVAAQGWVPFRTVMRLKSTSKLTSVTSCGVWKQLSRESVALVWVEVRANLRWQS